MKIAYVYDAVYPYVKGGAERRTYEIGRRLSDKGHEIHWYGMKWWDGENSIQRDGMTFHGVCAQRPLYTSSGRRSIKAAVIFSLRLMPALVKAEYDLIDCQQFPYLSCFSCRIISAIKKKPLVITWHEIWGSYWKRYLGFFGVFGEITERLCAKLTRYNVAVSQKTKARLAGLGVSEETIRVVPNGINLEEIKGTPPSQKGFDVLYAGRLVKEKNISLLIKSVKIASISKPDISLGIMGDGPEKTSLVELTKELGLENNITYLGFADKHSRVYAYMKSSRIFALPSSREGFSISTLEALACGTPVITVNEPMNAATDLITEGRNGFIVNPSEKDLSEKIMVLLNNPSMRDNMSKEAIGEAKKYAWDEIAQETERYYGQVDR